MITENSSLLENNKIPSLPSSHSDSRITRVLDKNYMFYGSKFLTYFLLIVVSVSILLCIARVNISFDRSIESKTSSSKTDILDFTLGRVGYDNLPYFSSDINEAATYEILKDYDAIIEPSAMMELRLLDTNSTESSTYRYQICDTADSSNCFIGIINNSTET
jgi:hypothetical protein